MEDYGLDPKAVRIVAEMAAETMIARKLMDSEDWGWLIGGLIDPTGFVDIIESLENVDECVYLTERLSDNQVAAMNSAASDVAPFNQVMIGDWVGCFDHKGWCRVDGVITGLFRSDCQEISCLEKTKYVKREKKGCQKMNWWSSLDKAGWHVCPQGKALEGLFRNSCNALYCIEEASCCEAVTTECYNVDIGGSFDHKGWATCNYGYALAGFRSSDGRWSNHHRGLYNIETLKCCRLEQIPAKTEKYQLASPHTAGKASDCQSLGCTTESRGLSACFDLCDRTHGCNVFNFVPKGATGTSGLNRCCRRKCSSAADLKLTSRWKGWDVYVKDTSTVCQNIDGGYQYGNEKRYQRGWALSNGGHGEQTLCDKLCQKQPECQLLGQTCTSLAFPKDDRCYCSFCKDAATEPQETGASMVKAETSTYGLTFFAVVSLILAVCGFMFLHRRRKEKQNQMFFALLEETEEEI